MMRGVVLATLLGGGCAVTSWEGFKAAHMKTYPNADEEALRKMIFEANMVKAEELNAQEPHARFGASPFADLSETEFQRYHNAGRHYANADRSAWQLAKPYGASVVAAAGSAPIDWRARGAVTSVKDQGACGSCWAFSTTGNVEGQWFLAGHPLVPLSEEQLVDCDTSGGDQGCNGGLPMDAYKYIADCGGLESEADYAYDAGRHHGCAFNKSKVTAVISGGKALPNNEAQMLAFLEKQGPISVGVNAASGWQTYVGGILSSSGCPASDIDHGVLAVGYGTDASGGSYWIVKNSWGSMWGEQGYIRLAYGENACNIKSAPSTAVV